MAQTIVDQIRQIEVGESIIFSEGNLNSIQSTVSRYGFQWRRKYRCIRNREDYSLTVTRIS